MKRMNRKRILDALESARQGFNSIATSLGDKSDLDSRVIVLSARAQHHHLNTAIVELGGESVTLPKFPELPPL